MSNEFQEKLQLYKEGKLNQDEIAEIEYEIDKFSAISDYFSSDDKAFLEELKQEIPASSGEENIFARLLKRKVNLRIIMMTAISVLSIFSIIIFFYFMTSNIVSTLFGFTYKEAYVKRATIVQLAQLLHPQYESHRSGVDKLPFAQQNIHVSLDNTVGNTTIDETEVTVKYRFGNPVKTGILEEFPQFLPIEFFSTITSHESDPISGFQTLERAPQGTKARILVIFNKALTPKQLKEGFINQLNPADAGPPEFTPLVSINSKFVISNLSYYQFTPVFPYDNSAKQNEDNRLKQIQYEHMDNQAHKESLIGNLNLIKNNQKLLQVMYNANMFQDINMDDMIKHVENKGVEYVGMYISAGREDLLKLKGNPLIHGVGVEDIVVW
jgi:hypothetical protein